MTTTTTTLPSNLFSRILIRSAKLPIFYFLIGFGLSMLSYIDELFPFIKSQHILDMTDKLGSVFFVLASVTFIYNIFSLICHYYERKLMEKHSVAALILSSVRKALRLLFILVSLNFIIMLVGPTKFYLIVANNLLNIIIIGSIGWIAIQILYTCEAVLYQYMITLSRKESVRAKGIYTKMHIIRNITTVVIIVLTIAAVLMSFNSVRNIGISLLASAGFLTAIIGLAAQKTLFSVFSGLQIALGQQIKIGDIVVIENVTGVIEEITFTYVTLKLGDKRRMIVPINFFIEKPFENWSRDESLISSMHLYVDFMLPIDPLRAELDKILGQSTCWDKHANKVEVSNLTERAVEIRMQISAANADDLSDLRAEVREKILEFIRQNYPDHFPKVRFNNPVLELESKIANE